MIAKYSFSVNGKAYYKGQEVPEAVAVKYPQLVESGEPVKEPAPEKKELTISTEKVERKQNHKPKKESK